MKAKLLALGALLLATCSSVALAQTAQEMVSNCRPITRAPIVGQGIRLPQTLEAGTCWGSFHVLQDVAPFYQICADTDNTVIWISVFVEYADRNPRLLHYPFYAIAVNSLQVAFPCNSAPKTRS